MDGNPVLYDLMSPHYKFTPLVVNTYTMAMHLYFNANYHHPSLQMHFIARARHYLKEKPISLIEHQFML